MTLELVLFGLSLLAIAWLAFMCGFYVGRFARIKEIEDEFDVVRLQHKQMLDDFYGDLDAGDWWKKGKDKPNG